MSRVGIGKLFRNGRSQAVRLPQEFRFRGDRVRLRKVDKGVLMEAIIDVPAWFAESYKKFYPPFSDYDKLKAVDWEYYTANQQAWQDAESKGLGL